MARLGASKAGATLGNRIAPARFLMFTALLAGGYAACRVLLPGDDWRDCAAMAFDGAAAVFLLSLIPLLRDSTAEAIRRHAARNDANRLLILALTTVLTVVAMAAIAGEIAGARGGEVQAIAKLVGTLLLIWLFANSVYALHYAHAFYLADAKGADSGGIDFPGTTTPATTSAFGAVFTWGSVWA